MSALDQALRIVELRRWTTEGTARRIREASGLTVGEAAAAIDVDTSTVWRWENGIRAPRGAAALRYWELLRRLQRAAQVPA